MHERRRITRGLGAVWLLTSIVACGHLGVELDGDASVLFDASDDQTTGKDSHTKPPKTEDSKSETATYDKSTHPADAGELSYVGSETGDGGEAGLDASADASDGAVDASLDAAVDASELSTSSSTSATDSTGLPIADDNAYTCDPLCECAAEEACDLECKLPECIASCGAGGVCAVHTGEADTITVECGAQASCSISGAGPDVHMICKGEGECQAVCGDGQKCDIECLGTGECTALCLGTAACHVNCSADSHCYVNHTETAVVDLICPTEALECAADVMACNGPC